MNDLDHGPHANAEAGGDPQAVIRQFEDELAKQEDLVYGIALFFEGISFLYAGQDAILLTYHKQLRNIIRSHRQAIEQAAQILADARKDPRKAGILRSFKFSPGQGHPQPEELCRRAISLVDAYKECFPNRSREEPFTREEVMKLLDAASQRLELIPLP